MNNSFKTVLSILLFTGLIAFNATAEDKEAKKISGFASGIFVTKEDKINVNIDKFNQKQTIIILSDHKGNVLYHEAIDRVETKMRRSLDLSQLPSGTYLLEISSNGEKETRKLELTEHKTERLISMK